MDAAVALQDRGHEVEVFTSYHQDGPNGRSFQETRDGKCQGHVWLSTSECGDQCCAGRAFNRLMWGASRHTRCYQARTSFGCFHCVLRYLLLTCFTLRSLDPLPGTLKVHVLGGWLFPPALLGRFTIVCAILRQLHLVFSLLLACLMWHLSSLPLLSSALHPIDHPFKSSADWSWRRQTPPYDVIIVDQLSTCIPLLRWIGGNRVVFYCHFPDQLLVPNRPASHISNDPRQPPRMTVSGSIKSLYRKPIDELEQATTGEADKILVNSDFTSEVFVRTFRPLGRIPRTVYPCVDFDAYGKEVEVEESNQWLLR